MKGQASELLAVYSILRHFVEVVIGDRAEIAVERASFDAACQVIDLLLLAKRGCMDLRVAATTLRATVADHLSKHQVAYEGQYLKPKHHWMFDVCDSIERDSRKWSGDRPWTLIDAFVTERNNLRVRGPMEHIKNTMTFEKSILAAVTNEQVRRLNERDSNRGLIGATQLVGQTLYAAELNVLSMAISVGDIIRMGGQCGEVVACALQLEDCIHYVIVETLELLRHLSPHSNAWRKDEGMEVWKLLDCEQVSAWYQENDSLIILQM